MTWADSVLVKMFLAKSASTIWALVRVMAYSFYQVLDRPEDTLPGLQLDGKFHIAGNVRQNQEELVGQD
jgi:hypothetical protein